MAVNTLFAMTAEFEELFNRYDEIVNFEPDDGEDPDEFRKSAEEAWFTTLDCMEEDIEVKAENTACYIKYLTAQADAMKAEEKRLHDRRTAKENAAKRLKDYLMCCMDSAKLAKIDRPKACVSVRNNAESVNITSEDSFIDWALKYDHQELLKFADPTISKTAVKSLLKNGEAVPFAELVRTRSVVIK